MPGIQEVQGSIPGSPWSFSPKILMAPLTDNMWKVYFNINLSAYLCSLNIYEQFGSPYFSQSMSSCITTKETFQMSAVYTQYVKSIFQH